MMFDKSNPPRPRLTAMLAITLSLLYSAPGWIGAADAQVGSSDATKPQPAPLQDQPQAGAGSGTGPHQTVITPPPTGDAQINKEAPPPSQFPTPVIHPPKSSTSPSPVPQKE
jgi:hypothetical protein